ncbi:MAG: hypothetical protein ACD_46C00168G0004 [uncultured bacterium]|nr:MAG: hypothetical protein ACD_46C00168G0004 [uncultured bacterium]
MGISALIMSRAIFLDRDGVLNNAIVKNGKPYPPSTLNEVVIADDVLPSLQILKHMGYLLIGATNQPDVARGTADKALVESINQYLMNMLPLDVIRICYHDDADDCACRKPSPGLLTEAASEYQIDLNNSFMIGDRWKDIEAGQRAGCKTIWIDRGYQENFSAEPADVRVNSLSEATRWIKQQIGN